MNNHQITELLKISMSSIKEIADVDMIVGGLKKSDASVLLEVVWN